MKKTIFLHGLGQDSSAWDRVICSRNGCRCIDLFPLPCYSYQALRDKLEKELGKEEESFFLVGLSLGAVLALDYALHHPGRVEKLVLIAPQYRMPKHLLLFQEIIFSILPEKCFSSTGIRKKEMIGLTHSMLELDYSKELPELIIPTLILIGERDLANRRAAEEMNRRIRTSRLVGIRKAGHEVNINSPEDVGNSIFSFLEQASD